MTDKHIVIDNNDKINLLLVQNYDCKKLNDTHYYFKLCKKTIITLKKYCKGILYFKFNNCFKINDNLFEIDLQNLDNFIFKYKNINYSSELYNSCIINGNEGFNLIKINTNEFQIENEICFDTICIPVKPCNIENYIINYSICLTNIGEFIINPNDNV